MSAHQQSWFDVDTVARYLYHLNRSISPLKLQKSLYFLFAYHGALYARQPEEGKFEGSVENPRWLFDARFEAWQYGPVIRDVWHKEKAGTYLNSDLIRDAVDRIEHEQEIMRFIGELFPQIDVVSDFQLVERSHADECWKEAYKQGRSTLMDNEAIIAEYVARYV